MYMHIYIYIYIYTYTHINRQHRLVLPGPCEALRAKAAARAEAINTSY